jgi:Ca2+-transporting ATPase
MLALLFIGIVVGIAKFEMFLTSVSLAVAAIPEGLPAVITLCLAFAVKRMLKVKALIRKLPAAETLGRVTVICSDKTGTITREELKVVKVLYNSKIVPVNNQFLSNLENTAEARLLLKIGCMASNARLEVSKGDDGKEKEYFIGDATEKALLRTAKQFGFNKESLTHTEPRIKEFAFTSERKMMSIVRRGKDMRIVSYVKGSPETILQRCNRELINGQVKPLTDDGKKHLLREYSIMASEALRVIAFAYKFLPPYKENVRQEEAEYGLIFVGFQGIFDAPREEVKEAIEKCEKAGISVKMITGDSLVTAKAVAKQIGLTGEAIEGRELKKMEDDELAERIDKISIFARVDPADKVRIISMLKQKNEIVAATGDGVNDAPALKKADIGIAMGVRGSDVTRDIADIVLLDDHFASIVKAVEEGRRVYDNIKKFTYYMLSTNLAEIFIVFFALLLGIKLGWKTLLALVPLQILWVNLVSDSIIAVTISRSPAEKNVMQRKPEKINILTWKVLFLLLGIAAFITIITLIFFARYASEPLKAQTIAFTTLVLFEGFNAFNFSSFHEPAHKRQKNYLLIMAVALTFLLQLGLIYLPFMQKAFHTTALTLQELILIGMASVSILVIGELSKIVRLSKKEV